MLQRDNRQDYTSPPARSKQLLYFWISTLLKVQANAYTRLADQLLPES